MPAHREAGNNQFAYMPTVISNTPVGLVPQELFKEEKTREYWNVLSQNQYQEHIGVDHLEYSFLLYPKPQDVETIHEITLMYNNLKNRSPKSIDAICLDVYENDFNLLVLKDMNLMLAGYFHFNTKEDIVYHLANVSQHFFEDLSQITYYYKQLSPKILHFLEDFFEMQQL